MVERSTLESLNRDPDKERDKGAEYYRKTAGLDALLEEKEARAKARESRYEKAKEDRTPDWVRGLQAASGSPYGFIGRVGRGATASRDENAASDAKFADDMDNVRDIITKAKIDGNTAVANAGIKALEQLRIDQQNARTSGTSIVTERERTASAERIARDNRAAQLAQHNAPTYSDKQKEGLAKEWLARKENAGKSPLEAMAAVSNMLSGRDIKQGTAQEALELKRQQLMEANPLYMQQYRIAMSDKDPAKRKAAEDILEAIERKAGLNKPAAPSGDNIQSKVEAAGQKYEPTKYEYRVAPDGSIQRKAK